MKKLNSEIDNFIKENEYSGELDSMLKKLLVDRALIIARGNQTKAAKMLGINRGSLRSWAIK